MSDSNLVIPEVLDRQMRYSSSYRDYNYDKIYDGVQDGCGEVRIENSLWSFFGSYLGFTKNFLIYDFFLEVFSALNFLEFAIQS